MSSGPVSAGVALGRDKFPVTKGKRKHLLDRDLTSKTIDAIIDCCLLIGRVSAAHSRGVVYHVLYITPDMASEVSSNVGEVSI